MPIMLCIHTCRFKAKCMISEEFSYIWYISTTSMALFGGAIMLVHSWLDVP